MIAIRRRAALAAIGALTACKSSQRLRVIVPEPRDLEDFLFWVALGSGAFTAEGLAIDVTLARAGELRATFVADPEALALLPAEALLELVAEEAPIVAIASLLARDLHHLVLHPEVPLGVGPLRARLASLRGRVVGVAPEAEARLDAVFAASDLSPRLVAVRRMSAVHLNGALAARRVDGIFVASPQLERALVWQDATIAAAPTEVPALSDMQLVSAVAHRRIVADTPKLARAFVRALARGLRAARRDPSEAASALLAVLDRIPAEIEPLSRLYVPALPATVAVSAERLYRAASIRAGAAPRPRAAADLEPFIAHLAEDPGLPALLAPLAALAAGAGTAIALRRARTARRAPP